MRLNFKEKTFGFKFVILMDRALNVMTGGTFQECLSTRSYIQAEIAKPLYRRAQWVKVRDCINWMFWDGHCYDSFKWEMGLKKLYIDKHKDLLK